MKRPNFYDYLKVIAIIAMIIDHCGYYFFPDQLWMRLIGRIAFPIFLFLVGFSFSYRWRWDIFLSGIFLWIAQLIVMVSLGFSDYGMNILIAIVLARAVVFFYQKHPRNSLFWMLSILAVLLHTFLLPLLDYGSLAILFALWGYLARSKSRYFSMYGIGVFLLLTIQTLVVFGFGADGNLLMPILLFSFFMMLYFAFQRIRKANFSITLHPLRDNFVLWTSKKALTIYVVHLLIFLLIFYYLKGSAF